MISGIILVKNQAKQLESCLASLSFCDEIIVVDDHSNDDSVKVAEKYGSRVYKHKLHDDFAQQRNWAVEKAKNEWVLFLDADEIVSSELATEIYQLTSQFLSEVNGFSVMRTDFMWNKKIKFGDAGRTKLLRLAKKTKGHWEGRVHERWSVVGEIGKLHHDLYHYPHQSISEFLDEVNFYSSIRAQELYDRKKSVNGVAIVFYPVAKFIFLYVIKLGFLDGSPGILCAVMMSFYSFLVRSKLWQLKHKKRIYNFGNE